MNNLIIDNYTMLYPPDHDGDVRVSIVDDDQGIFISKYVPFKTLEKWIASIQEQITD